MKHILFIFMSMAVMAIVGCDNQQDRVPNNPPNFDNPVVLASEYGTIKITDVSAFVWPDGVSGDKMVDLVSKVSAAAKDWDGRVLDEQATQTKLDALDYKPCFLNFEVACVTDPNSDDCQLAETNDTVQSWKYATLNDVPDNLKALYNSCQNFSTVKSALVATKTDEDNQAQAKLDIIYNLIDPGYDKPGPNYHRQFNYRAWGKNEDSRIILTPGTNDTQVEIHFEAFIDGKNYQSSVDGKSTYDSHPLAAGKIMKVSYVDRVLKFKIPEVKNGVATGGVYCFELERNNFGSNPRFSGDMNYVDSHGVKHMGSAKFDGQFQQ